MAGSRPALGSAVIPGEASCSVTRSMEPRSRTAARKLCSMTAGSPPYSVGVPFCLGGKFRTGSIWNRASALASSKNGRLDDDFSVAFRLQALARLHSHVHERRGAAVNHHHRLKLRARTRRHPPPQLVASLPLRFADNCCCRVVRRQPASALLPAARAQFARSRGLCVARRSCLAGGLAVNSRKISSRAGVSELRAEFVERALRDDHSRR